MLATYEKLNKMTSRLQLLQQMPIFGGIREEVLRFLLSLCPIVSVAKGQFFFHENDEANSVFVLEAGRVAVLKHCNGQLQLLGILGQGDCFGEMALMDLRSRSADVVALEDCTAIELSSSSLHKLYEKDVEQFALIQMNMGREVSRRLRHMEEELFK